jgi:hypothetical protein
MPCIRDACDRDTLISLLTQRVFVGKASTYEFPVSSTCKVLPPS